MDQSPNKPKKGLHIFVLAATIIVALGAIGVSVFILMNPHGVETNATEVSSIATISNRGITPRTITVKKGSNITWTNQDVVAHKLSITSPTPPKELEGFGSDEAMAKGESYSFTFDAVGTFTYADPANPQTVQGTIIVE